MSSATFCPGTEGARFNATRGASLGSNVSSWCKILACVSFRLVFYHVDQAIGWHGFVKVVFEIVGENTSRTCQPLLVLVVHSMMNMIDGEFASELDRFGPLLVVHLEIRDRFSLPT